MKLALYVWLIFDQVFVQTTAKWGPKPFIKLEMEIFEKENLWILLVINIRPHTHSTI